MKYGSVASGIGTESHAWAGLGFECMFHAENDPRPASVLARHFPDVPNLGDMNGFKDWPDFAIDLLVGGTPCQSFSIAGLRAGLDDPRGSLMLVYGAIARRYRPLWFVWENVVGVLSNNEGRDFGDFLGLMSGQRVEVPADGFRTAGIVPGIPSAYGLAWRVLDAEYVRVERYPRAVPQRRRRVFVVGHIGDWRRAAAVLLEPEGLRGDPPPRRTTTKDAAGTAGRYPEACGVPDVARCLKATDGGIDREDGHTLVPAVANPLTARMFKGVNTTMDEGQTMIAFHGAQDPDISGEVSHPIGRNQGQECCVAYDGGAQWRVRRLMPVECERLQGLPDDWTKRDAAGKAIKDGPRYHMLGNGFAAPPLRWIAQRIKLVHGVDHGGSRPTVRGVGR